MPMFSAEGQKHFLGGNFYTVKQGATFTLEGDGGGTDFHIGGSTRRTVVADSFNNGSRTIGGGGPYHRGADPTAAFAGRRGKTVYPGMGRGRGSVTMYDDIEDADIRNVGNNFSTTIGSSPSAPSAREGKARAPGQKAEDDDEYDDDDDDDEDEDPLYNASSSGHGNYARTVRPGFGGTNGIFQHAMDLAGRTGNSTSYSTASFSATDVRVSHDPKFAKHLRKVAKVVQNPAYHEHIMAATGGPTFTDVEPGTVYRKVENSRKTVIIDHENIENSYYNNVGNDTSYTRVE